MKSITGREDFSHKLNRVFTRALIVAGFLSALTSAVYASLPGPGGGGSTNSSPNYTPLDSWSFHDNTNWTSDLGFAPISFSNLAFSNLGDGASLVVDSANPAWLQYHVIETSGATNFSPAAGSVSFWFAPSWSSTNQGGSGPGEYGRLFEVGGFTTNSSFGLWSIYVDAGGNNLYFSAQTNDLSGNLTTYLSAPISWTPNYFHNVVVTYSATNTALYLDGAPATNGPPMTVYPGPNALANGLWIGSDSNGVYEANGLFNDVYTYNVPLDAGTIQRTFTANYDYYMLNPLNSAMFHISDGSFNPPTGTAIDVVTGQGNLQSLGMSTLQLSGTGTNNVWITNVTATAAANGTMNMTFTIEGGQSSGTYYDVFITDYLDSPISSGYWAWQGQSPRWQICSLTGLPNTQILLILGTPQDSDSDGLTDAYELLVSKTSPTNAYSNADGILDGWEVLLGLNPQANNAAQPSERANYYYTQADWLYSVSGVTSKNGSVTLDNEGNVKTVSQ
jgi:hypothetical protein